MFFFLLFGINKLFQVCNISANTLKALILSIVYSGDKSAFFKDNRKMNPENHKPLRMAKLCALCTVELRL